MYQCLSDLTVYVPKKVGTLRQSARINKSSGTISWNTPYARRRYYESGLKFTTPNTGERWDVRSKANHISAWENVVKRGLKL